MQYKGVFEIFEMEKEIEINGKKYKIRELTIDEGLNFQPSEDTKKATYEFVLKSLVEPQLTIDELKALPFKEGLKLIQEVNALNGLSGDFTQPKVPSATN